MDAKVNTEILSHAREETKVCMSKLQNITTLAKATHKILEASFESNQTDIFKSKVLSLVRSLCNSTDELTKANKYLQELEKIIEKYDHTRY